VASSDAGSGSGGEHNRRCTDEYGGIEYGGLLVKYSAFVIRLYSLSGCTATYFGMHYRADNLAFDAVAAARVRSTLLPIDERFGGLVGEPVFGVLP
jgi:hypothetical protein